MSKVRLTLMLGVVVALLAAVPATASPVPDATYYGVASDGAGVTITVSPDGTLVTAYELRGVPGDGCQFYANGSEGDWAGSPIEQNSFSYQLGDAILLQGTFTGAQTVQGTFDLHRDASGSTAACDSGTVNWTATTSATPPPGGGGSGGGSGSTSGSGSGSGQGGHHRPPFKTSVFLRGASRVRIYGTVKSPVGACRARRMVYLWRGSRRVASTKSAAGGKFWFPLTAQMKGRPVRASVALHTVGSGACAAASSVFVKG